MQSEVGIEITVLSDDGGALAACLIAAGVALTSAGVECFDVVLACHLLIDQEGKFIVDPCHEQLSRVSREGGQWAAITIGVMPALEKVIQPA